MYISVYKGVVFIEGTHPEATPIRKIKTSLSGFNTQLKNLNDVKERLIYQVGGDANTIMDFEYGQESTFLQAIFIHDDIRWYGFGTLAKLPDEIYNKIIKDKK